MKNNPLRDTIIEQSTQSENSRLKYVKYEMWVKPLTVPQIVLETLKNIYGDTTMSKYVVPATSYRMVDSGQCQMLKQPDTSTKEKEKCQMDPPCRETDR